jgi:hypothetical protein
VLRLVLWPEVLLRALRRLVLWQIAAVGAAVNLFVDCCCGGGGVGGQQGVVS